MAKGDQLKKQKAKLLFELSNINYELVRIPQILKDQQFHYENAEKLKIKTEQKINKMMLGETLKNLIWFHKDNQQIFCTATRLYNNMQQMLEYQITATEQQNNLLIELAKVEQKLQKLH
jgi:hypothetical protein